MNGVMILSFLIPLLASLLLEGCVTVPKGPLQPDEVRLTKAKIIETTTGATRKYYKAIIDYQHGEKIKPDDIKFSCTTWYWNNRSEGPTCGRIVTIDGNKIEVNSSVGVLRTYTIEMYVIYMSGGKEKKSNLIRVDHSF